MNRTIEMRVLPDGRVRIHWFLFDANGPVQLPRGVIMTNAGPKQIGGAVLPDDDGVHQTRGMIACEPKRTSVTAENRRGTIRPTVHSDDPRAVTCDLCMATAEWKAAMARLQETLPVGG